MNNDPVYLSIKRKISLNEPDPEAGYGTLDLFVRTTDPRDSDTVELYLIVEVYGRWHAIQTL